MQDPDIILKNRQILFGCRLMLCGCTDIAEKIRLRRELDAASRRLHILDRRRGENAEKPQRAMDIIRSS